MCIRPERDENGRIIPYKAAKLATKRERAKERGAYSSGRKRPSVQIAFYNLDRECKLWAELAREQGYRNLSELALVLIGQHFGSIPDQAREILERIEGGPVGKEAPQSKPEESYDAREQRERLEWEYAQQNGPPAMPLVPPVDAPKEAPASEPARDDIDF